jgi:hypothetical protein
LDVHPPHSPIHSVKDFLIHLLAITIGLLIALALEATAEWYNHRHLVHEAEDKIAAEINANQQELNKGLPSLRKTEAQLQTFVQLVHQLENNRNTPLNSLDLNWTVLELHETSWSTAASTGALGHMSYDEVGRYTRIYGLQHKFDSLQDRAWASANAVVGLATLLDKDANKITESELENAERAIGVALANARAEDDVGKVLLSGYAGFATSN